MNTGSNITGLALNQRLADVGHFWLDQFMNNFFVTYSRYLQYPVDGALLGALLAELSSARARADT